MTLMKFYIKENNFLKVNKIKLKLKLNKMVENLEENSKEAWKVQDGHGYTICAHMMIMHLLLWNVIYVRMWDEKQVGKRNRTYHTIETSYYNLWNEYHTTNLLHL